MKRTGEKKDSIARSFASSTLSTIMKNKDTILAEFEGTADSSRKKARKSKYEGVEACMRDWYFGCRRRSIPLSGPTIQSQAKKFASMLGHGDFQASNRWLELFKKRNRLVGKSVCGESGSVDVDIIRDWIEVKLPKIIEYHEENDI